MRVSGFVLLLASLSAPGSIMGSSWDSWRLLNVSRVLEQYLNMKFLTIFGMSRLG